MRVLRTLLCGLAAALVCMLADAAVAAAPAEAATVGFVYECENCATPSSSCDYCEYPPGQIGFHARPGEVNDVTVDGTGSAVVFTDAAGGLTPGARCSGGPVTVTCDRPQYSFSVVRLGDRADRLRASGISLYVYGDGDGDVIEADGYPRFDGGPGDDVFAGAAGGCCMGAGVLYGHRTDPVKVTLGNGVATTGNGQAGESDTIGDLVTSVDGGRAADTITGDDENNSLYGGGGGDTIRGRGGTDYITNEGGSTEGGSGDDYLYAGRDLGALHGGDGYDALGERWSYPYAPWVLTLDDQANDGPVWNAGSAHGANARIEYAGNVHSDVEALTGGPRQDLIIGDADANRLRGGEDRDAIAGGKGPDEIDGGEHDDALWARDQSADRVLCGTGNDVAVIDEHDYVEECESIYRGDDLPPSPDPEKVALPPYERKPPPPEQQPFSSSSYPPSYYPPSNPGPPRPPPPVRPPRGGALAPGDPAKLKLDAVLRRIKGRREWVISGRVRGADVVVLQGDPKKFEGRYKRVKAIPATRSGFFRFIGLRPRRDTRYRVLVGDTPSKPVTARALR